MSTIPTSFEQAIKQTTTNVKNQTITTISQEKKKKKKNLDQEKEDKKNSFSQIEKEEN